MFLNVSISHISYSSGQYDMIRGTVEDGISSYNSTIDRAIQVKFEDVVRVQVFFLPAPLLDSGANCFQTDLSCCKRKFTALFRSLIANELRPNRL
ncbi:hypothetical protein Y032_0157g3175 [Ancylostoma ceylanicum]|uniref:Uncharacterized protein n=1 Tax=Ancylostoma ceylanicum TaxID=53326 RepID=A0A016SY27_9BILA|nr:hypothetical protein Y032_0157g3175 [Ancylostoma ceylanicum]